MLKKPKLIHNQNKKNPVFLHPRVLDILFEHRRYVKSIFLQIKGHYEIDYFGINMINPKNELISFSSMPHIEYNLIQQHLWTHDLCFSSKDIHKNALYYWDEVNLKKHSRERIQQIRLVSNRFSAGMTLAREIDGFQLLYSYATHSTKSHLKEYYQSQIFGLIDVGDYFCNSVLNLYSEYCADNKLPRLTGLNSKACAFYNKSGLKLVVNNS